MSTAKRRINSTGRKKIFRDSVDIRMLDTAPGQHLKATAKVDFSEFKFPESAVLAIEAYHQSSGMRFECGTIGNPEIPEEFCLDEVDHNGSVLFRVKIIDAEESPGKILGAAERIRPRSQDDLSGKRSLFPVITRKLGSEVWKVQVDEAGPVLVLNYEIPGFTHKIAESPFIQGLLLPAAFRTVLENLLDDLSEDFDEEEECWETDWIKYCRESLGVEENPVDITDPDEKKNWIDDAVRRFCESCDFVDNIKQTLDGEH